MTDKEKCRHVFVISVDERKLVWPFCMYCHTLVSTKIPTTDSRQEQIKKNPRKKFVMGSFS